MKSGDDVREQKRQQPAPLLDIGKATVYRGASRVFHDLTLRIPSGCHAVILGPNGSGKSTLLKLLTREIYPVAQDGSFIRVMGLERWNVWDLRKSLGIVSHDLQTEYLGSATGYQVVLSGFTASLSTWSHQSFSPAERRRAIEVMRWLEVAHLSERHYDRMSTGEQRRCLLARALVHDPGTLVLDEPTSGLDVKACFQYLSLVRTLMRQGKSVVIVTHHIHEIPPQVDLVFFFKKGSVAASGPKANMLTGKRLSDLFGTPIRLVSEDGAYFALPGTDANVDRINRP